VSATGSAWRIVRADHARAAFTGEGSRILGGRWNSRGVSVIYASQHESLAALELLVHTMPLCPLDRFLSFRIEWNARLTEYFPVAQLPTDWNSQVPTIAAQRIGDDWVHERRTAVLAVPAVLTTSELNFLLNPNHPDFKKIKIGKPIEYRFDSRLLRR
jgi:RES domain-containing protein